MIFSKARSFLNGNDANARILRGFIVVAFFLLAGKIAGALKEVAVAYRYGMGENLDIYLISMTLVTWIPGIWMSILQSIYVPLVNSLQKKEKILFSSQFFGLTLLMSIFLILVVPLIAYSTADIFTRSFSPDAKSIFIKTTILLAPISGITLLIIQFNMHLLAAERHVNTLMAIVPALILILAMLLPLTHSNTITLSVGTVLGVSM